MATRLLSGVEGWGGLQRRYTRDAWRLFPPEDGVRDRIFENALRESSGLRSSCGSAADGGNDGDDGRGEERSSEAPGVARILVADKHVDVLAQAALFGEDAIADAGIERARVRPMMGARVRQDIV